jgi:hypothetical protein
MEKNIKGAGEVWAAARVPWIQGDVATKYLTLGYEPFHASDDFIFLRKKIGPKKTKKKH